MKRQEALAEARAALAAADVAEAPLESELLLRHVLGLDRARLYAGLDAGMAPSEQAAYRELVARRRRGEPSAYITGHREFYGLGFSVGPGVLIPRPETELLVETAIGLARQRPAVTIADVGTGCGAIAVTLASHLPGATVYATDVSARALAIARENCRRHGVAVRLLEGSLLAPLPEAVDMIVANLPYVRAAELGGAGLDYEPALALDGGGDGLSVIAGLCRQAPNRLRPGGCLLLEIGQGQEGGVRDILHKVFPAGRIGVLPDLAGIPRVVSLHLT